MCHNLCVPWCLYWGQGISSVLVLTLHLLIHGCVCQASLLVKSLLWPPISLWGVPGLQTLLHAVCMWLLGTQTQVLFSEEITPEREHFTP